MKTFAVISNVIIIVLAALAAMGIYNQNNAINVGLVTVIVLALVNVIMAAKK